ncbi:hypothetical protein CPC08DRAFT_455183 [Agrocybe pediades]|nr:hypothetical protein CPC08DRAFT_455183 [Agrocybe pediades]
MPMVLHPPCSHLLILSFTLCAHLRAPPCKLRHLIVGSFLMFGLNSLILWFDILYRSRHN